MEDVPNLSRKQLPQNEIPLQEDKLDLQNLIESVRIQILAKSEEKQQYQHRTDDEFILRFLRVKKFNVEETVKRIQKYQSEVHRLGLIKGIRVQDCSKPITQQYITVLKNRIQDSGVLYLNYKNWDTKEFSFRDQHLAGLFLIQELLTNSLNQTNGISIIVNLNGFGISHLRESNVFEVKNAIQLLLMGLPVRLIGVHLINFPKILWPLFNLAIKILSTKIQNRFHIHPDIASLLKLQSTEQLPESLGGCLSETEAIDNILINSLLDTNPVFDC